MQRPRIQVMQLSLSPPHCSFFRSRLSLSNLKPTSFSSSSSFKFSPWSGLEAWRESPLNHDRIWGPNGPQPEPEPEPKTHLHYTPFGEASTLAELGSIVLSTSDPLAKSRLSHLAYSTWRLHSLPLGQSQPPPRPARPPKPQLVRFALFFCFACYVFASIPILVSECMQNYMIKAITTNKFLCACVRVCVFFFFL